MRASSPRSYVLVVEDEADTRRAVASALLDAGLETVVVPDGATALTQCRRRDPAVIVLDLALPGLDGPLFADAYRRFTGSKARILVMSATPHGAETSAKLRADAYISKPFSIERLVGTVQQLMERPAAEYT